MKRKKSFSLFLCMAIIICITELLSTKVTLADNPSSNRGVLWNGVFADGVIYVTLEDKGDSIENITVYSGSSGEVTEDVIVRYNGKFDVGDSTRVSLMYYATKAGTYRIQYDTYGESGEKTGTGSQTLFISGVNARAITMSLDGKNVYYSGWDSRYTDGWRHIYTEKKAAKVKFKAADGCTIKKIEIKYWNGNKQVIKSFRNGKKVTFSKYGEGTGPVASGNFSHYIWAYTTFTVYYTDSYSSSDKSEVYNETFVLCTLASKWAENAYGW